MAAPLPTTRDAPSAPRRLRWRRGVTALLVVAASLATPLAIPPSRTVLLREAGEMLVLDEPIAAADVIVVAVDAGRAGALEAADLVHEGVAPRVAFFVDPTSSADIEFARRGIPEDGAVRLMRDLRALGVAQVERIPGTVSGTEEQGATLPGWIAARQLRSAILVTNADHSRRLRRVLNRSMRGSSATVRVRVTRYSNFKAATWWHTRMGVRIWIEESQKLLLDVVRHPFS